MTILGQHSVAEVRDLASTVEFRIRAVHALIAKKNGDPNAFTPGHPGVAAGVIDTWNTWLGRWRRASDSALGLATALSLSNPLVSAANVGAEGAYKKLKCAINASCDDTHNFGDMFEAIQNVENDAEEKINERNAPQPTPGDPDLVALQKLDAAIKSGEAAALKAKNAVTPKLPGVPWWVWVTGAAVVGGVGYSVVKTGQGVAEKAKRDTEYIHEKMTSKVLPGYKG